MQITKQDIATLIHDCRAPARHIRQFAKLAKADSAQYNNEGLTTSIETIIERVLILEAMIDGFAEIAGIATAKVTGNPVDLRQLTESEAQAAGILLDEADWDDMATVSFDPALLTTAVQEIVKNASQHAANNTLKTSFRRSPDLGATLEFENQVAVAYEQYPGNLSMPFTKPDKKLTPESMGVGLALAQTAMLKGGGSLSTRYEGNSFIVTLQFKRST